MGKSTRAIFLSYASQDAAMAQQLADALRATGAEVWLDQSELRGGDAWDAKIRHQIGACALFVPVISAATQARPEGYFRLEWRLAHERTKMMAFGTPFVVPAVLDGIAERVALVPRCFQDVQWTRLAGGDSCERFAAHVSGLLRGVIAPVAPSTAAASPRTANAHRSRWRLRYVVSGTVLLMLATAGAWLGGSFQLRKPAGPEKSLAVLPFVNMSDEKDNGYFTDGVHEDLLTSLALIGDLKVTSRTSVMGYRDTTKPMNVIGRELGVAYILEGSVRRVGNKVRVTGQLIDTRTDEHVWARTFDREVNDVFVIQSALAEEISRSLDAALTPQDQNLLDAPPTRNAAAYDAYLRGREVEHRIVDVATKVDAARREYEQALALDPSFIRAAAAIAQVHLMAYAAYDQSPERLDAARRVLENPTLLQPDAIEILTAQFRLSLLRNDTLVTETLLGRLNRLYPERGPTLNANAEWATRRLEWSKAHALLRKVRALDPRNPEVLGGLLANLAAARRWREYEQVAREWLALLPAPRLAHRLNVAEAAWFARGSTAEVEQLLASIAPADRTTDPEAISVQAIWYFHSGDATALVRLWEQSGSHWRMNPYVSVFDEIAPAMACQILGDETRAHALAESARLRLEADLQREPSNVAKMGFLGHVYALLGDEAAALRWLDRARSMATADDPVRGGLISAYAWTSRRDEVVDMTAQWLRDPHADYVKKLPLLRHSLEWRPLQGDARFQALLDDPAVSAPLF